MMHFRGSLGSLVLVGALCGCGLQETHRPRASADKLPRLEVVRPIRVLLPRHMELAVTIEPMEKADLCARVPGVVDYLPADVDIGRRIKKGEKLVGLHVPDLDAQKRHKETLLEQAKRQKTLAEETQNVARKDVDEAIQQEKRYAADHAFLKLQHERVQELVRRGAQQPEREQETRRQLDAAAAAWDAAKATIETRRAKLSAAGAELEVAKGRIDVADAELKTAVTLLELAVITAPFDGIITRRLVDHGATIRDPGTPLLAVMRVDRMRVLLDVPERDVPLVNAAEHNPNPNGKGDPVTVRIPVLGAAGAPTEFEGHVVRLAGALDPNTRTMRTEVHLDNAEGHLRPGLYGTATVLLEERYGVLTIPATALVRRGNALSVYVIADVQGDPPTGVVKRLDNVEIGLDDGKRVEIRSGVGEKELVIVKGSGVVQSGDRVHAVQAMEP